MSSACVGVVWRIREIDRCCVCPSGVIAALIIPSQLHQLMRLPRLLRDKQP